MVITPDALRGLVSGTLPSTSKVRNGPNLQEVKTAGHLCMDEKGGYKPARDEQVHGVTPNKDTVSPQKAGCPLLQTFRRPWCTRETDAQLVARGDA